MVDSSALLGPSRASREGAVCSSTMADGVSVLFVTVPSSGRDTGRTGGDVRDQVATRRVNNKAGGVLKRRTGQSGE